MDPRAWIVAALFGLATGIAIGRGPSDRTAGIATLALTVVIGAVVWFVAESSAAGPSLVMGCGVALVAALVTAKSVRQRSKA